SPIAPRHLPSFPTRRSSDLAVQRAAVAAGRPADAVELHGFGDTRDDARRLEDLGATRMIHNVLEPDLPSALAHLDRFAETVVARSEEHTSELQSRFDLVCRL